MDRKALRALLALHPTPWRYQVDDHYDPDDPDGPPEYGDLVDAQGFDIASLVMRDTAELILAVVNSL